MNKKTNILIWILQILMALYFLAGGTYMLGHYKILANPSALNFLPGPFWSIIGVLQILFALGLVLPGAFRMFPKITPVSAIGLTVVSLLGIVLYSAYTGSGILWAILPALLTASIAYKRSAQLK